MKLLRTPDNRFRSLLDYNFQPSYSEIRDRDGTEIRIHTIDTGPRDAAPVLLMHGEPSWSYLYRKILAGLDRSLETFLVQMSPEWLTRLTTRF